jgi:hypothetical protein
MPQTVSFLLELGDYKSDSHLGFSHSYYSGMSLISGFFIKVQ